MRFLLPTALLLLLLSGCGSTSHAPSPSPAPHAARAPQGKITAAMLQNEREAAPAGREVALYSLMLLRTAYNFGGKNPSAGLDCSGLVSHVYGQAAQMRLTGNAAALARQGREITVEQLRAGDLVFFNTLERPFSHVGIYLGNGGQFIHAPNSRGRVRVEKLTTSYWSQRFEMARTLFD